MSSSSTLVSAGDTRSGGPWSRRQFGALIAAQLLGLLLVCVGGYGAGGTGRPTVGLRWLALSALGLMCVGIANGTWLMIARRRLMWARVQLLGVGAVAPRPRRATRSTFAGRVPAADLVTHARAIRYHRSTCDLMTGRDPVAAARTVHEAAGLRGCEVCEP